MGSNGKENVEIDNSSSRLNWRFLLLLCCVLQVALILIVGLWPLTPYCRNAVAWSSGSPGLFFGRYGWIHSAREIEQGKDESDGFTIEIWLQDSQSQDSSTILSFYSGGNVTFRLSQALSDLVIERGNINRPAQVGSYLDIDRVFRPHQPSLITVTSGNGITQVFLNAAQVRESAFPLSQAALHGMLVIGNDPLQNRSWSGLLQGLAVYPRQLRQQQILQHYKAWNGAEDRDLLKSENPQLLYLFSEGQGDRVHTAVANQPDLQIPARYEILKPPKMASVTSEFHNSWGYWQDVIVNVAGFVPYGFLVCAYVSLFCPPRRAVEWTIASGFILSLLIEILQSYLPTRDSSTTDVVNNTIGALLGTWAFVAVRKYRRRALL